MTEKYQRFLNLRHDTVKNKNKKREHVQMQRVQPKSKKKKKKRKMTAPNPCYVCEGLHFMPDKPLKQIKMFPMWWTGLYTKSLLRKEQTKTF